MRNIRLVLSYDGTRYCGWQTQSDLPSIQQTVETVLQEVAGERCNLIGSGRTDSGAHALGQVANFRTSSNIDLGALKRALNGLLPADIRVLRTLLARDDFHARFDARKKTYRYQIFTGKVLSPFDFPFWHHVPQPLDGDAMSRAAKLFLGRRDFSAMAAASTSVHNRTRRVDESCWKRRGHCWTYQIEADGFLHHMVRNIVGTLLEVGLGRLSAMDVAAILKSRDRRRAGPTVPAKALFLVRVKY